MSTLAVPLHVSALALAHGRQVLGPTVDPTTMPWSDGTRDHFGGTPPLASAMTAEPFDDRAMWLGPGVHGHWTLPSGLTRGSTRASSTHTVPVADLWFPPVPNRWLFYSAHSRGLWLIESDFIHPDGVHVPGAVAYPLDRGAGRRPWVHLGRSTRIEGGTPWRETCEDRPEDFLPSSGAALTAVGPEDPTFAAFHASSRSVFGGHDPQPPGWLDDAAGVTVVVFGWYSPQVQDPLPALLDEVAAWSPQERLARLNAARVRRGAAPRAAGSVVVDDDDEELQKAVILERFGWELEETTVRYDALRATILFGGVRLSAATDGSFGEATSRPVTAPAYVGASGTEAIARLLADEIGSPELEAQLEAAQLGPLSAPDGLDLGTALAEFRHRQQFVETGRHRQWTVRSARSAVPGNAVAPGPEAPAPTADDDVRLPTALAHELRRLAALQADYDAGADRLESLRQQLFADWHRLMTVTYPEGDPDDPEVDIDHLLAVVRDESLPAVQGARTALGSLTLDRESDGGTWSARHPADGSVAARLVAQVTAVTDLLTTTNASRPAERALELTLVPGSGFWRPRDPVVAVRSPRARGSHSRHVDATALCARTEDAPMTSSVGYDTASTWLDGMLDDDDDSQFWHEAPYAGWNPVAADWQAEVHPLVEHGNVGRARYEPDFVEHHVELADDAEDLAPRAGGSGALAPGFEYIAGRAVLVPGLAEVVADRLSDAIDRIEDVDAGAVPAAMTTAHAHLADVSDEVLVATLGGFHDGLLTTAPRWLLPVADPLGFADEQQLADEVRDALGGLHPRTPRPDDPFHPIRSGELVLERLRLVDTFGQTVEWRPATVHGAGGFALDPPGQRVRLPLRLSQGARLDVAWLAAADDLAETDDHPATSPVCGWLLPTNLDGTIQVHDAAGALLGSVDSVHGRWQPAPGSGSPPMHPEEIGNRRLAAVVTWIVRAEQPAIVVAGLLDSFEDSTVQIEPTDLAQHTGRVVFVGRPLAVVRLRAAVRLHGLPATDQSWETLRHRLLDAATVSGPAPGADHGMPSVRLPLRIGRHDRLTDGVVGYWPESHGKLAEVMLAPHGGVVSRSAEPVTGGGAPVHWRTVEDPDLTMTMLVDPRAPIHLTTGILPTQTVLIAPQHFAAAIESMRVTVAAAPVLTPAGAVALPVPHEPGVAWAWLQRGPDGWSETPEHPSLTADDLERALPGRGSETWQMLTSRGIVRDVDQASGRGRLVLPAPDDPHPLDPAVLGVLLAVARSVRPVGSDATFTDPTAVRDGWLQLRSEASP